MKKVPQAHKRHGDKKRVFASDDVADAAEDQGPQGADRKSRSKGQQCEDEADVGRHIGKKVLG
jgi:hypothetical protein